MIWAALAPTWRICLEEAWTAYCAGSVPIGACITDSDGSVLARGRNRMFEPPAGGDCLAGNRMAHAEMNALLGLRDWQGDHPMSFTLYTIMEPCPMCMGAIRMVHVGRVCYAARDVLAGGTTLVDVGPYVVLSQSAGQIEIVKSQQADLEGVILAIQAERLLHNPHSRWADMTETLEQACAPGVRLGRKLYASGELGHLRDKGCPVQEVVDWLSRQLRKEQDPQDTHA